MKNRFYRSLGGMVLLLAGGAAAAAQQAAPDPSAEIPLFKAEVVSKSAKAINYEVGTGATRVDLKGTAVMPAATGEAKVESKKGYIQIDARVENMDSPMKFGAEYLTYVLWSISPEGRCENLGEIQLKAGKGKISATTELQIFGLFITAEPYYAVRQPSDVIVVDNELRKDTRGKIYIIESKLELLKKGQYEKLANPLNLTLDTKKIPLELYEARNAVMVARMSRADKYAKDTFSKADASLKMAERYPITEEYWNEIVRTGRQAVQIAEDSRAIAVERQIQEQLENERAALQKKEQEATLAAEREARARAEADARSARAEQEKQAADQARQRAEQASMKAEQDKMRAEVEAARAMSARLEAEMGRTRAEKVAQEAEVEKQKAQAEREKAEAERRALRQKLLEQFNAALPTRDTERGLVVNLGDVLFDTGKFNLRSEARESLARLAGICLAYPDLRLEAEGHTDATGSDDLNQKLSEQRAASVVEYLVAQGLPKTNLSSQGFGKTRPVAANESAQGRQQNRRVELIVSGQVIGGTSIGKSSAR